MTYFADLSPYTYDESPDVSGLVNIGWLDASEPFIIGRVSEIFLNKLFERCKKPDLTMRGFHTCNICPPPAELGVPRVTRGTETISVGYGEIRIPGPDRIYAAPTLIYHYVTDHSYRPPDEFVAALLNEVNPDSGLDDSP